MFVIPSLKAEKMSFKSQLHNRMASAKIRLYICSAYSCVSDSWALLCPLDFVNEIEIVKLNINLVMCSCKSMNYYFQYIPVSHFHLLVCFSLLLVNNV